MMALARQISASLKTWSDLVGQGLAAPPLLNPSDPKKAWLRTLMQADGDMLITIDREFLGQHPERVGPEISKQLGEIEARLKPFRQVTGWLKSILGRAFAFCGTLTAVDLGNAGISQWNGGAEQVSWVLWFGVPTVLLTAAPLLVRGRVRSMIDERSTQPTEEGAYG